MTLQEYLGQEFQVKEIKHKGGKISFNVKREGFEYETKPFKCKGVEDVINIIGLTVMTRYGIWKYSQSVMSS